MARRRLRATMTKMRATFPLAKPTHAAAIPPVGMVLSRSPVSSSPKRGRATGTPA